MNILTHEIMLKLTENLPMKLIRVNDEPYLERHYWGKTADGVDLWLHHFLTGDGDRHVHNHPFNARSTILVGHYTEDTDDGNAMERRPPYDPRQRFNQYEILHADPSRLVVEGELYRMSRPIGVFDWHRIIEVAPGTWTLMMVERQRLPLWYFRDLEGNLEPVPSTHPDWWRYYGTRKDGGDKRKEIVNPGIQVA